YYFTAPPTTVFYTLSLHDALPIYDDEFELLVERLEHIDVAVECVEVLRHLKAVVEQQAFVVRRVVRHHEGRRRIKSFDQQPAFRSEEHTSELQSRENLVCRLLLEK